MDPAAQRNISPLARAVRPPSRRLSPEEAALWARVTDTVRPFEPVVAAAVPAEALPQSSLTPPTGPQAKRRHIAQPQVTPPPPPAARMLDGHTLDANWDRRLARGMASPDFTLDLHGATLDAAYARLNHGLTLAVAQGARLVLLITGRPRPQIAPADRSSHRGAIRAKFLDWLAQGNHASRIAAIRPAHPRHGGAGAVYIILRKPK